MARALNIVPMSENGDVMRSEVWVAVEPNCEKTGFCARHKIEHNLCLDVGLEALNSFISELHRVSEYKLEISSVGRERFIVRFINTLG